MEKNTVLAAGTTSRRGTRLSSSPEMLNSTFRCASAARAHVHRRCPWLRLGQAKLDPAWMRPHRAVPFRFLQDSVQAPVLVQSHEAFPRTLLVQSHRPARIPTGGRPAARRGAGLTPPTAVPSRLVLGGRDMTLLNRVPSSLVRVASCALLAAVLGLSSAPGVAAADLRVMGRLALSFGSGDWSLGVRADADARERRTDRLENSPRPVVDPTTRFSGTGGRFESLRFNGLPVVSP